MAKPAKGTKATLNPLKSKKSNSSNKLMTTISGKTKPANDNKGYFTGCIIDGLNAENNKSHTANRLTIHTMSDRNFPNPFIT